MQQMLLLKKFAHSPTVIVLRSTRYAIFLLFSTPLCFLSFSRTLSKKMFTEVTSHAFNNLVSAVPQRKAKQTHNQSIKTMYFQCAYELHNFVSIT